MCQFEPRENEEKIFRELCETILFVIREKEKYRS